MPSPGPVLDRAPANHHTHDEKEKEAEGKSSGRQREDGEKDALAARCRELEEDKRSLQASLKS